MGALLHDLTAAGVQLHRDGDRLHVIPPAGVSLDPLRERIQRHKPGILRELLQQEIQAAVTVDPSQFDRERYDALWREWSVEIAQRVSRLETGWDWMRDHPTHPEHDAFYRRWLTLLREYEQAYGGHTARPLEGDAR